MKIRFNISVSELNYRIATLNKKIYKSRRLNGKHLNEGCVDVALEARLMSVESCTSCQGLQ